MNTDKVSGERETMISGMSSVNDAYYDYPVSYTHR
jgi:hypothetical protein